MGRGIGVPRREAPAPFFPGLTDRGDCRRLMRIGTKRRVRRLPSRRYGKKQTFQEIAMKVKIDADLCTACGLCVDSVPDVFQMGDDVAEVKTAEVSADLESAVKEAVDDCPVEAIIAE